MENEFELLSELETLWYMEDDLSEVVPSDKVEINSSNPLCMSSVFFCTAAMSFKTMIPTSILNTS
ncbi:hypothetical protein C8R44DRAFT_789962 [Mycena epipterygia]|nr:hypothetical protein C8R44DRAFT_789962 [Mycena epipterygia]